MPNNTVERDPLDPHVFWTIRDGQLRRGVQDVLASTIWWDVGSRETFPTPERVALWHRMLFGELPTQQIKDVVDACTALRHPT